MLISKTFCPAGSLLYIVPTGLQVTLHYNALGNITDVYQGFDRAVHLGEDFMKAIVRMGLVPNAVHANSGATDVCGVFYSDRFECSNGLLPNCEYDRIISEIMSGTSGYKLYVGKVVTGSVTLTNAPALISWASLNNFQLLDSWFMPEEANDQVLHSYTKSINYKFKYPLIAGYLIYESFNEPYYKSTDLRTATINKAKKYTDLNGYIKYDISYGDDTTLTLNYPEAVQFNIFEKSQIVLDRHQIIWCSTTSSETSHRLSKRLTCEFCHKILDVPEAGVMQCTDDTCKSLLYNRINRLCTTLEIKAPSYSAFKKLAKNDEIQSLPDLFLLPDYQELTIDKPLWEVIKAVIPAELGVADDWLIQLCNKCHNEFETVNYYFNGPLRINTELDMEVPIRLARWLDNARNMNELSTIVNSNQIHLRGTGCLANFNAPLLFLHKTIYITGVFKSGSQMDIITILQSYGAAVVTEFDEYIDYVVVGDIKENINGEAIQGARSLGIPVIDESVFFNHFGIDQDLANNLV
jgi:hypothetical protein